jgi:hypothetical protein
MRVSLHEPVHFPKWRVPSSASPATPGLCRAGRRRQRTLPLCAYDGIEYLCANVTPNSHHWPHTNLSPYVPSREIRLDRPRTFHANGFCPRPRTEMDKSRRLLSRLISGNGSNQRLVTHIARTIPPTFVQKNRLQRPRTKLRPNHPPTSSIPIPHNENPQPKPLVPSPFPVPPVRGKMTSRALFRRQLPDFD